MWLTVSSQSPRSLHLLFCWVMPILALIWFVLIVLSCAALRRDSVSFLRFTFLSRIQVFSCVYHYYFTPGEFYTLLLADGFSLSSGAFLFVLWFSVLFLSLSKCANSKCYYRHTHVRHLSLFSSNVQVLFIPLSSHNLHLIFFCVLSNFALI